MVTQSGILTSLKTVVTYIVTFLAVLMTAVIFWGALDVVFLLCSQMATEPYLRIGGEHLLTVFGSFLTVLIAIEIFLNIVLYLTKNMFHVQLVVATALTAVARKVIVLEYSVATTPLIYAMAALVMAVAVAYWVSNRKQEIESE